MSSKREPKQHLVHQCTCGCGTETRNAFAPGHDNRFYGQVVRGERDASDLQPFPGLMRKWTGRQAKAMAVQVPTDEAGAEMARFAALLPIVEPKGDMWTEDQPNQTSIDPFAGINGERVELRSEQPADLLPQAGATQVKDGRWWYTVKAIRPLSDGRYEVDWHAKNGGARTTRVTADKLR
jgi:hypothetical protein